MSVISGVTQPAAGFIVWCWLNSKVKRRTQDVPLDDSPCVSCYWAHTVRKPFPASSVDNAGGPDMIPHISGACRERISRWRRWLICSGSDSSNTEGILCKQTPAKLFSLNTSEMNHPSLECWAQAGGDSPCHSRLESKLQGAFLPLD